MSEMCGIIEALGLNGKLHEERQSRRISTGCDYESVVTNNAGVFVFLFYKKGSAYIIDSLKLTGTNLTSPSIMFTGYVAHSVRNASARNDGGHAYIYRSSSLPSMTLSASLITASIFILILESYIFTLLARRHENDKITPKFIAHLRRNCLAGYTLVRIM